MTFRIQGLAPDSFAPLFAMTDAELAAHRAVRRIASDGGFPCRISLTDAAIGDEVILVHHAHHAVDSPFRASHAIYVRRGETQYDAVDAVPAQLAKRLLSVRAYDDTAMMIQADVVAGAELAPLIARFFDDPRVAYLHVHFARQGCYAARVERA